LKSIKFNTFRNETGADILSKPVPFLLLLIILSGIAFYIAKSGLSLAMAFFALPFILSYVYFIFMTPAVAITGMFILNYFILGLARYVQGIPWGMAIDAHLVLAFVALFFQSFFKKVPWDKANSLIFKLAAFWFIWVVFQFFNPMATARPAWFFSMRGVGLYMFLTIPLILILYDNQKALWRFITIWGIMSILGSLKGIVQKHVGLDPWEQIWLNGPGADTHLLFGKLRVFSFFTDAGQFGASQGHSGLVFMILATNNKKPFLTRFFYILVGSLALYGMMISGTRGSIAVPIMGLAIFTMLQKNLKVMVIGALLGISVIVFFKYTTMGNGNYTINRMRTAFNPEDKSLQVRLENQRRLKSYMASKPIGNGIGSTSSVAKQYAPGSLAATIPTDSWYVMIWVEQGIVGLAFHLAILFFIVIRSSYVIMFKLKDPWVKTQMSALVSGMFGIMVASYGNQVFGQMPTGILLYSTMAFLFLAEKLDSESATVKNKQINNTNNYGN
jgi:hypothetical protein